MKAFIQHTPVTVISDKMVLQTLIPFTILNSRAIFTQKALSNDIVINKKIMEVEGNANYYQRSLDLKRLRDIKKYIYNSVLDEKDKVAISVLFPTSMILAIELKELPIVDENGIVDLDLSEDFQEKIYIVDGQHRLMAMRSLYYEIKERKNKSSISYETQYVYDYIQKYKFNCTLLVNFDIWEQSQVFVNVNFKQKPVNRSLYYDVFGAEYIDSTEVRHLERNKIYLAHEITRFLNKVPTSPFYNKIKMLGTGSGYVSQAFFVEAILPLFKDNGIWYYDPSNPPTKLNAYKSELFNFYCVIKECFKKYWGETEEKKVHFICKTTGVGAFTRLMATLHDMIDNSIMTHMIYINPSENCEAYRKEIRELINPLIDYQDMLFGEDSKFAGTGGKGLENNFYKEMIRILIKNQKLKQQLENRDNLEFRELKNSITQKNQQELHNRGIENIEELIENYMNENLPSEIDTLGNHCSVETVENLFINSFTVLNNEKSINIKGTFSCKVNIAYESNDSPFISAFPGLFTLQLNNNEEKWEIDKDETKIYVETENYYK